MIHVKRKHIKYIVAIQLFFCGVLIADTAEESSAKTAFMIKMTHFINWPKNVSTDTNNSPFIICLDGSKKHFTSLEEWAKSGTIKKRPVILKYIYNDFNKLNRCKMLYITDNNKLSSYLKFSHDNHILTFSSSPGNAQNGVIVNFFEVDENLRFEINLNVANNIGFEISPRLLKLAKIINSEVIY